MENISAPRCVLSCPINPYTDSGLEADRWILALVRSFQLKKDCNSTACPVNRRSGAPRLGTFQTFAEHKATYSHGESVRFFRACDKTLGSPTGKAFLAVHGRDTESAWSNGAHPNSGNLGSRCGLYGGLVAKPENRARE